MKQDSANKQLLDDFKNVWEKAGINFNPKNNSFDAIEGWQQVKEQIETNHKKQSPGDAYLKSSGHGIKYRFLRVAAIFIAAAFIGYFGYLTARNSYEVKQQEPILQEIATENGQRTHLTLSEGTSILLNAGSKIRLPKIFKQDKREVYLEGQAYFKVAENPDKPFIIHLEGTTVRVLGTEFSVSAYPEDETVQVVVKEGRVSFEAKDSVKSESAIVTANELVRFDEKSNMLITREVSDLGLYLGWIDGSLNFKQTVMTEVAVDLERRYGVTVTFADEAVKEMKLTAHLKSKRIKNVLDVISISLKIKYELKNNHVTFYK